MMLVFGVVAVILLATALASGIVERFPLSFPLMFLGLKLVLGKQGFGAIELGTHDQILEVTATPTLALVLFLDTAQLQIKELGPLARPVPHFGLWNRIGNQPGNSAVGVADRIRLGHSVHKRCHSGVDRSGCSSRNSERPPNSPFRAPGSEDRGKYERHCGTLRDSRANRRRNRRCGRRRAVGVVSPETAGARPGNRVCYWRCWRMVHAPTTKPMAAHIGKKRVVATFVDLFIVRPKPTVM